MSLPTALDIRYSRMYSEGGNDVIMLKLGFSSISGVRHQLDVPVLAREGKVVDPSVFMVNGAPRIIAPSAISDLIRSSSFSAPLQVHHMYGPPKTLQQSQETYKMTQTTPPIPRSNRHMFSAARAAMAGPEEFSRFQNRAQMTEAVRLLDEWQLPMPQSDEEIQKILDQLSIDNNIDPMDALEAIDIVYELWNRQASAANRTAHNLPPAAGDVKLSLLPVSQHGNRLLAMVSFDAEQSRRMSDGYLRQIAVTYLKSQVIQRRLGFVADVQVTAIDRNACAVHLNFTSTKVNMPQLHGGQVRVAALAPQQQKDHLDPAERAPDQSEFPKISDSVTLKKDLTVTSRGGISTTFDKGATGLVVGDVQGDGLMLVVCFPGGTAQVPRQHVKAAKEAAGDPVQSVVDVVSQLRKSGYAPIDAIMRARDLFGTHAEAGLRRAKGLGLI